MMSAAVAFQMNGVGSWFQRLVQSWIKSSSSATLVNVARRRRQAVSSLNQLSMRLVQPYWSETPRPQAINVNGPTTAMRGRGSRCRLARAPRRRSPQTREELPDKTMGSARSGGETDAAHRLGIDQLQAENSPLRGGQFSDLTRGQCSNLRIGHSPQLGVRHGRDGVRSHGSDR